MQEIEKDLKVGYAVLLVDVNADGKKDIVVVDTTRVVWYENPSWKRRSLIEGKTQPDNVCIAAHDIDGDGQLDFALGAAWNPGDTKGGGTLQWLKRGQTLDEPWSVHPIDSEPTLHRIRFADIDGSGKPKLIVVPLFGRGSTRGQNYMDVPVRVLAYSIPNDPARERWSSQVLDQGMHVIHNFCPIPSPSPSPPGGEGRVRGPSGKGMDILTASYEGVSLLARKDGQWTRQHLGTGNQDNPKSNRGASEIKQGSLREGRKYIATIEPWHGNEIVAYTPPREPGRLWDRHLLDNDLKWGHAVWCADLDGDGDEELVIGVRDDLKEEAGKRRGVRIFKAVDGRGAKWARTILDSGGVATEDLACADLNGDGRIDIVAVGRQTHNVRIYWNEGKK
jgi:hypothetical protein